MRTRSRRPTSFQFTPLREGRRRLACLDELLSNISIHAPPRGATHPKNFRQILYIFQFTPLREGRPAAINFAKPRRYFNSRPSARGDATFLESVYTPTLFQFTPLREGRLAASPGRWARAYFNSRPSARGDAALLGCAVQRHISIHAPPRGATDGEAEDARQRAISIHAPPRGATAKDMQFLQIFCSTLTNQHGLTIVPRNLSRLFW